MAELKVTIPEAIKDRVIDGVAYQYKYQDSITELDGTVVPNPETKVQFVKKVLQKFIKNSVKAYEANKDAEVARQAALDKVESEIELS